MLIVIITDNNEDYAEDRVEWPQAVYDIPVLSKDELIKQYNDYIFNLCQKTDIAEFVINNGSSIVILGSSKKYNSLNKKLNKIKSTNHIYQYIEQTFNVKPIPFEYMHENV